MTKIRTVLGDIPSDDIGNIMMHEHVLFDISLPGSNNNHISKITTKDRWQVNYLSNRNPENACQKDIATAVDELGFFRQPAMLMFD